MPEFICTTCGVQYPPSAVPPEICVICNEERQYVKLEGQSWTTLDEMRQGGTFHNEVVEAEEHLHSFTTRPSFAIGQTAYFVRDGDFGVLWDCITYVDDATFGVIRDLGGIQAIALSHPHYYSTQVTWAEELGVPIYIHEDDREWVVQPSERVRFWTGESLALSDGLTLHRLGGHYKGGAVLHWARGAQGKGTLLTGDIIQVVSDRQWVSFMYSYPNLIPLPAATVSRIADKASAIHFDRIYGAFHRVICAGASESVRRSAQRYIAALEGKWFTT